MLAFVWCAIPLWVYCVWGLPLTEKLLTQYVMPVGLVWNLLILGSAIASFQTTWFGSCVIIRIFTVRVVKREHGVISTSTVT